MDVREMAINNILDYSQDNPFDDGEKSLWTEYNIIYKEELDNYFRDKKQSDYAKESFH